MIASSALVCPRFELGLVVWSDLGDCSAGLSVVLLDLWVWWSGLTMGLVCYDLVCPAAVVIRWFLSTLFSRASAKMLTVWGIAHAVDDIAHPVTGISWILPTQWK